MDLKDVLQKGQEYILESGKNIKVVEHEVATNTCFEKAELLKWKPERIIKTTFFCKEDKTYGFVFPELGVKNNPQYIDKQIISDVFRITKSQAKKFRNSYCPEGMEYGTCTPFVLENNFKQGLENIFICDLHFLEKEIVDISIGGKEEHYHKLSLHLKYKDIWDILYSKFGTKIKKFNF